MKVFAARSFFIVSFFLYSFFCPASSDHDSTYIREAFRSQAYRAIKLLSESSIHVCDVARQCNKAGDLDQAVIVLSLANCLVACAHCLGKVCVTDVLISAIEDIRQGTIYINGDKDLSLEHPAAPLLTNCVLAFCDVARAVQSFMTYIVKPYGRVIVDDLIYSDELMSEIEKLLACCADLIDEMDNVPYSQMVFNSRKALCTVLFIVQLQNKINNIVVKIPKVVSEYYAQHAQQEEYVLEQ